MKISILLPDLRGGGAERVSLDLAYEFARQGHQVEFVLLRANGELLAEASSAFQVVDLNCPRARVLPPSLVRYVRLRGPDALLAAMWPLTVIAPLVRLFGYHGRVVISEHNTLSVQYRDRGRAHRFLQMATMALSYRLAHARFCVSNGVADDVAVLSGLHRKMFDVVHNPVPHRPIPSSDSINHVEALWGLPRGPRIITVGSLKAQKNHSLLLRAFAQINQANARLMLVGAGTEESSLRQLASDLAISKRVIFAGFQVDPTPYYKTADLFVLSSDHEGLPTVLIEALSCGLPIVSTDCPSGPAEILENGRLGELVPVGDAEALAQAIGASIAANHDCDALRHRAADFAPSISAGRYLARIFPKSRRGKRI